MHILLVIGVVPGWHQHLGSSIQLCGCQDLWGALMKQRWFAGCCWCLKPPGGGVGPVPPALAASHPVEWHSTSPDITTSSTTSL